MVEQSPSPVAAKLRGDLGAEAGEDQARHQRRDVSDQPHADDRADPVEERRAEVRLHRQERAEPDVQDGHDRAVR